MIIFSMTTTSKMLTASNKCCATQGTQGCDCTISLFSLLPGTAGTQAAARVARASLLPVNTLDLEHVPPGAYVMCFSCAMCTPQPPGFRLSHAMPPAACDAAANTSTPLQQASAEAPGRSVAAKDARQPLAADARLRPQSARPQQCDIQLAALPPAERGHGSSGSSSVSSSGSSGSGNNVSSGMDRNSIGEARTSSATGAPASAEAACSTWLPRLVALAVSAALVLTPRGALHRITTVRSHWQQMCKQINM